jgi:hypothetical protein
MSEDKCVTCGIPVSPGWRYCEECVKELLVENPHEYFEEKSSRYEREAREAARREGRDG